MRNLETLFLVGVEGTTEIWLVRHADAYDGGVDEADPALSPLGREQATRLADRLRRRPPAAIYSSPARRAIETAQAIGSEAHVDRRLVEMTFEITEDQTFSFTETPEQVVERMGAAVDDICAAHPGKSVVVVSHAGAIANYLCHVLQLAPGQLRVLVHFASISVVRALGDRRMVGALNDTAHLE